MAIVVIERVISHRQAGDQSIDDGELADKAGHRFRAELCLARQRVPHDIRVGKQRRLAEIDEGDCRRTSIPGQPPCRECFDAAT